MRVVRLMLAGSLLLASLPSLAAAENKPSHVPVRRGPETTQLDHSDVSPPLRLMRAIPPAWEELEENEHPVKRWPRHNRVPFKRGQDPLAAQAARTTSSFASLAATAGLNFDGVGNPNYSVSGATPDTVGAVGSTQYVQWVNTAFAVFNKSTGAMVYGPVNGNTVWQGFGGRCETDNDGDPLVLWDELAQRWVLSQFAVSAAPYYQCIAVSTTSDATGSYRRFAYQFGSDMNDYGKIGVWPDGYYITYNMFTNAQTWKGAKVCAYDRNQMLTASGTPGAQQCFQLSTTYGGLQPSDVDGTTPPPAGSPNYMIAFDDVNNNGLNMWKFKVDWATPANTTFTGPTKITTASFAPACSGGGTCITQPGTTQKLDSLADRLMYRLAYRNFGDHESLVLSHAVDNAGKAAVRWYELRSPNTTPVVYQQGTFAPDSTNHRWMSSIAMDQQGNIAMGYSASGAVKPSLRYTGRLASDPLNTMQAESELFAGTGVQTTTLSRWGDYSNLTVDPSDDCTFWFTSEYIKSNGTFNWSTRIGSFKFPSCGGVVTPDYSLSASPSSVAVLAGNSGTSSITVSAINGFSSAVTLSASGLPAGASASFSPSSVTPTGSSTLTLSTTASVPSGTYGVTITGTSGTTTRTTSVSLVVTGAGSATYDATLGAPKCGAVGNVCDSGSLLNGRAGLGPEPNQPNTADTCTDGASGTFHTDESNDKLKVTSVDGSNFAAGKQVRVDATVWAYSSFSSDKLDLYYAANASAPSWTLIGTLSPTAGGAQTLSATYTLPSGSLQAVRARFRYQGTAGPCTVGSYDDHDDLVFAVGAGAPDTTAPTTSITSPAAGATLSGTATLSANASDNVGVTKVEFYQGASLIGTATTSPYSVSWNTTSVANGSYSLTSKAYDAAGNVGTSSAVSVTVNNVTSGELITNGGFDTTTTGWTVASNWSRNASAYMQSANVNSISANNTLYQQVTIPSTATGALTFTTYITTGETTTTTQYDKLFVELRNTSGTLLTTLATYSNLNKSTGFVARSLTVPATYKGQTVRVQFRVTSDSSLPTVFRVDTVSLK